MEKKDLSPGVVLIRRARTLLIGTTVLWGLSFPLLRGLELAQRATAPDVPDAALASADVAIRFALAAIFLFPIYGGQLSRIDWREWSQAIGLALFAAGGLYLQTLGLAWTDASIAAFLTQLYTLIVPLIVAVRDRRFPSLRVIVACVLVLVGAAMLSPGLLRHFILGPGELVIILSTFFMASQIVWVERPLYAENRAGVVTLIMFAILAGLFTAGYFIVGGTAHVAGQLVGTPVLWMLTLALVLLCTVFNFLIMNAWQRCVSATEAGLIYCIEPVIATILSAFLPGWISRLASITYANETLTWSMFVGGVLIVSATVLVATERRTA
ncbi:MAG: DMT family transporter [Methylacidiphilales bacterium]|nr:DMT family transporter [Candidatus Methylacidiphilales bacterium]